MSFLRRKPTSDWASQSAASDVVQLADNASLEAARRDIEIELARRLENPLSERDALAVRVAIVKALVAAGRIAGGKLAENFKAHGAELIITDNGDDLDEWAKRYGENSADSKPGLNESGGREPRWYEPEQVGDGNLTEDGKLDPRLMP